MARHQRDSAKEAFWRDVLCRFAASGLSARAFCKHEQLAESAFYAWRRTIGERDVLTAPGAGRGVETAKRPAFVRATVAAEPRSESSIAIELAGGCVLRLAGPDATEQLADLVIALQARGGQ
jgi:transposase-like protein